MIVVQEVDPKDPTVWDFTQKDTLDMELRCLAEAYRPTNDRPYLSS